MKFIVRLLALALMLVPNVILAASPGTVEKADKSFLHEFLYSLGDQAKVVSSFSLISILLLSTLVIYFIIKRKIFSDISNKAFKRWLGIVFIAAKTPLILLTLSYIAYLALIPFFPLLSSNGQTYTVDAYFKYLLLIVKLAAFFWFIFRLVKLINGELIKIANKTQSKSGAIIAQFLSRNLKYVVSLITLNIVIPILPIQDDIRYYILKLLQLFLIGVISWICLELVSAFEKTILEKYQITAQDNLLARKVYTQTKVFKKLATVMILFFTITAILMTFESVRQYGTSLLASAGVLTAITGFAAQRSIAGLVAGLQIAISQPIRIDDAVLVENEFGFIEEISLTYVVIRLWDWRRLIVPINYFIEKPFQNWTRHSTNLIGVIFLYVDYTFPVDELRAELKRILDESELWDGKVAVIHVSDSKPEAMELRILASATNAPNTWDLRCEIREKLIAFIQKNYPQCLPKRREVNEMIQAAKAFQER